MVVAGAGEHRTPGYNYLLQLDYHVTGVVLRSVYGIGMVQTLYHTNTVPIPYQSEP